MGDTNLFQPLTKEDKITVFLYRTGIFLSTLIISISAFIIFKSLQADDTQVFPFIISGLSLNIMLLVLYFSVGLSVFFIHLYIGQFYRTLKKVYYLAVVCLAVLFFIGHGNPVMSRSLGCRLTALFCCFLLPCASALLQQKRRSASGLWKVISWRF